MSENKKGAARLQHAKKLLRQCLRTVPQTSLPEIALVSSFILGRYLINADFQYPRELIMALLGFSVLVTGIFFVFRRIFQKDWLAVHAASMLLSLALLEYVAVPAWLRGLGPKLLPGGWETNFTTATVNALLIAVLCGAAGYILGQLHKRVTFVRHLQPLKILVFGVAFVAITQAGKVGLRWIEMVPEFDYKQPAPTAQRPTNADIKKPDIYYLVFDRYANQQTLQDVYSFDNSPLLDFLKDQGFVTRDQAYANYPFTMESITSTLAMRYHTELDEQFGKDTYQAAFPYRQVFENPPVAQLLKKDGYTYNQVSSWWDFTRVGIQADTHPAQSFRLRILGHDFYLSDLERDYINRSIFSPWLSKGITIGSFPLLKYDRDTHPAQKFYNQMDALKKLARAKHDSPQFTFAHVLAPHDPYIFDKDGSQPSYDSARNDNGIDEREKYTRALTYINTQLQALIGDIRRNSPDAVIIIQADEGPYPKEFRHALSPTNYYDPAKLPDTQMKQKFGILASYYMPGVDTQMVTENITSSVNPFRFVLDHYLDYDLGKLPDCQLSTGNKFVIYRYQDVTQRLLGTRPPACDSPNTPL